jgi:hypothetical protein
MVWDEAKHLIKSGDLIAVSHQPWATLADWESHIVRVATESEYSHVTVAWTAPNGTPHVIEAVVPAVAVNPLEKYLEHGFFWIPMPDKPMSKKEEAYGLSCVGDEYSKLQAVAGQLNWLDVAQDRRWQCSELTLAMRRLSGAQLGKKATPAAVIRNALSQGYTLNFVTKD